MKASIAVVVMTLAGCTSLRGKADAAYARGDYLQAAELYDRVGDRDALAKRDRARAAELRVELFELQAVRAAGLDPTGKLAVLLQQRDDWRLDSPPGLDVEVSAAGAQIAAEIAARASGEGPLAGEDAASHREKLLGHADFATTRQAIRTQLAEAGRTRCTQLAAAADTPYWQALAARYCAHWSVTRAVPTLPDHHRALAVDGSIVGETDAELGALRAAVASAFERSAWYAPTGAGELHGTLDGRLAVAYGSRGVTLTASWTESIPYTDYETTQESYQEPYDDTETYDEQVPSTEDVPCGDTTCPQTVYHSETRTRTVTKYRTAWRDVTTPVTKYRDEPRTQDYAATERSGTYGSALHVRVDSGLVAGIATSTTQTGIDHDVTIGPAGVSPQRANLPSQEDFAAREQASLAARLVEVLDAEYTQRFCSLTTYTLEQAAECAHGGAKEVPAAARAALRAMLGGDEPYLSRLAR